MFVNKNQVFSSARALSFILYSMNEGDFDLNPSYQRDYVWDQDNAQNLLFSIFNGFPIGAISIIENKVSDSVAYIEVADGKQRCTTIYRFYKNEFPYIDNEGNEIYFKDMKVEDQRHFKNQVTLTVNSLSADISELDKYRYFYAINFAGIEIDDDHKSMIENKIVELSKKAA